MDTMESYRRAQDGLDAVLAEVRPDQWDGPSPCAEWTVRDVAGHVIWAQDQLRAWATGQEYTETAGAPGAPRPAVLAGADPVATWRAARERSLAALTRETLAAPVSLPGTGEVPLAAVITVLTADQVGHTWDVGHAAGLDVRLDPALVTMTFGWARTNVGRAPAFFGPELTPPDGADEQTRMLAFLGRAAWRPVPA